MIEALVPADNRIAVDRAKREILLQRRGAECVVIMNDASAPCESACGRPPDARADAAHFFYESRRGGKCLTLEL